MLVYENHCVGCATPNYPCIGDACQYRRVPIRYCDNPKCRAELDEIYEVDGEELCEDCLKEKFRKGNEEK